MTCGTGDGSTAEEQFIPYRPTNLRDTTPIPQGQVSSWQLVCRHVPSGSTPCALWQYTMRPLAVHHVTGTTVAQQG